MLATRPDMLATRRIEVPHEPVTERLVRGDVAVLEDRQVTERLKVVEADAEGLVAPPGDDEVYSYFGPQMRWVQVLLMAAYVLAGWSLLQFALASVKVLWPMLIVLGLNVIGTVLSALTSFNTRRVSAKTHRALFEGWAGPASNIDVSLPKYGEDLAVLRNTYTHVKAGGNPRLAHSRGHPNGPVRVADDGPSAGWWGARRREYRAGHHGGRTSDAGYRSVNHRVCR
jgi:hypothetical protein